MSRSLSPTELKRLHRQWRRRADLSIGVILDGVQNPYNLGAILRSAAAYRVEHLWQAPPLIDMAHPKVAKTALGCQRLVASSVVADGPRAVAEAHKRDMIAVALELTDQALPLFEFNLPKRVALVVGHEERGIHRDTLTTVDHVAYLPLQGKVGSLNVAHSLTVALYEVTRQAWAD